MKYLSLFSGIGGFELGIQQAYENTNGICDCDRFKCGGRQDVSPTSDSLLQPCGCGRTSKGRADSGNINKVTTNVNGLLDNRPTRENKEENNMEQNSADIEGKHPRQPPTCIGYSEIDKYAIQIYQKHFPEHKNYGDITKINEKELPDFELLCGGFPCQSFSIAGKRGGFNDTRGTMFFEIARILKAKQPRLLLLENVKGLLSHEEGRTFATIISTLDELGYDLQWQVLNSKNFGVPQNRERVFIIGHLRGTRRPQVFPFNGSNSKNLEQLIGGGQGNRVYSTDGVSTTLASQAGGQGAKTGLYEVTGTLDANYYKGDNRPNNKSNRPRVIDGVGIRRLTPKECERLQSFPDNWTEGVSDTQRYKCLGNAVTVNVIREIVTKLL